MRKIIRQFLKQVIVIVILIALVSILNTVFVKSSIRGDYDTVTAGITKGATAREIKNYLEASFKEELDFNKKIEVDAVGSFNTEFRIKSQSIIDDERDFMDIKLKDKYEEANLSVVTKNPEANFRVDIIMYGVYFLIVLGLGFGALYFLSLLPVDDEINLENIKKTKAQIIEEENLKLHKERKQKIKEEKRAEKEAKKEKKQQIKQDKDKTISKDKSNENKIKSKEKTNKGKTKNKEKIKDKSKKKDKKTTK